MSSWFKFKDIQNATKNPPNLVECFIYDEIGGFGVSAADFVSELKRIDKITNHSAQIQVNINSPGGDVFDGLAISNAIAELGERCTTIINGIAASAASLIACSSKQCVMCENALLMIHNPFTNVIGNATELRKVADTLDKCNNSIVNVYQRKCKNLSAESIQQMMDEETWLDANEAVALGFVDVIRSFDEQHKNQQQTPSINNQVFKRMQFKNLPKNLIITEIESEQNMEIENSTETEIDAENIVENIPQNIPQNITENIVENNVDNNVEIQQTTQINNEKIANLMLKVFDTCKNANIENFAEVGKASLSNFNDIDFTDPLSEKVINDECKRIIDIKNLCDLVPINNKTQLNNLFMSFIKDNLSLQKVRANLFDFMVNNQSENQVDNAIPVVEQQVDNNIPTPDEVYSKRRCGSCK